MTLPCAPNFFAGRMHAKECRLGALILISWFLAISSVWAAPYPKEGRPIEWRQPDGTELSLKVYGDEFYSRTTTRDGYTVVFSRADNTYYYAGKSADGASLISTGVPAHQPPVPGLVKGLEAAKTTIAAVRTQNIQKFTPDRAARWAARVKAVKMKRALDAGLLPLAPSGQSGPAGLSAAAQAAAIEAAAAPVTGSKVGLVILVQFPDDPATAVIDRVNLPVTVDKITRFCNEVGYADNLNTGSVRDYFYDQSNGQLTHTQLVSPIVTLPNARAYYNYSNYPTNTILRDSGETGRMLVADGVAKLKADGFDFSPLSVNAGNKVIATSLLFAGTDSGVWNEGLWPHAWNVPSPGINVGTTSNPRYVYSYQCTNVQYAFPAIGTVCHELGHLLLDLPDLYDYDGDSEGVGEHCLMATGNYLNLEKAPAPINLHFKDICGWANITDITTSQSLDVTLPTTGNRGYRIRKPGSTTEHFIFENRGSGDKWATYSPDKGIAIWHIDDNVDGNDDEQMTALQHYQVSIEQADGAFDLENNRDRGDAADLYDSTTRAFNNTTIPNAHWWSGAASGISMSVLSTPGANMNVRFGTAGSSTTLTVSPAAQTVSAAGDSPSFAVTSNATWSWTDDASWITSSEATSQTGNQTFTYTVAENTGYTSRTAVIALTSGVITTYHTITQETFVIDDHGDSTATATLVAQNSTTDGGIDFPGDNDYFRIDVTSAGNLLLQTTGNSDTYGYLLNSFGTQLEEDDESGAGSNFMISYAVTPGTYYVRVRNYYEDEMSGYQLVSSIAVPTLSANPSTQAVVAGGASHSFTVTSNVIWDWSDNAAWVSSTEAVSQTGTQTFSYTVAANPTNSSRSAIVTLTSGALTATHTINQAGVVDDHGNSTATATVVAVASTTNGNIETIGDSDYFRINATGTGTLVVQTTGTTNTYGELLNSAGTQLAVDDDAGASTNFQITYFLTPGTYYVRARHFDSASGTGAYQLVSSFTLAPNLTSYLPTGWPDKVVVSKVTGTTLDSAGIVNNDVLYIDYAIINSGAGATGGTFSTEVYVDNVLRQTFTESALAAGAARTRTDYNIGTLSAGSHTVRIKTDALGVLAESSETDNEYSRTFSVAAASNNANLSSLTPSAGSLNPAFSSNVTSYALTVSNNTASMTVTPTAAQGNAAVLVNTVSVPSGSASGSLSLGVGSNNTITTAVTAQDGTTTKSYVITVTRQSHRETWRQQYFGTSANSGNAADTADSDHDGMTNNLEYPFGLNPALPDSQSLPQAQKVGNNLVISFTQPAGVTGVTYGAVWSASLAAGSWQPVADTGSGNTHTFSVPMTTSPMFMRLTVTGP